MKIFGFPPVKMWPYPWKSLVNCPWKIKSPREICRQIPPVKTKNVGVKKMWTFPPVKTTKVPVKKNLAKFHEIYAENILIMNFVTITLSKRNHRWFFMEIRTFDLKRYRCFEFSIIHHKFTASSYRLLQLWLQNHLEKKTIFSFTSWTSPGKYKNTVSLLWSIVIIQYFKDDHH